MNWSDYYKQGKTFRQLTNEQLDAILEKIPLKNGSVLDIGCGRGELVQQFIDRGWEAIGWDSSEEAIRQAGATCEHHPSGYEPETRRWNLIVNKLFIAFEPDPASFFKMVHDQLTLPGYCLTITPISIEKMSQHMRAISVQEADLLDALSIFKKTEKIFEIPIEENGQLVAFLSIKE